MSVTLPAAYEATILVLHLSNATCWCCNSCHKKVWSLLQAASEAVPQLLLLAMTF